MVANPKRWLSILILIVIASLACFAKGQSPPQVAARPPHLLAVFIGGGDSDPTPEQIASTAPRGQGNSGLFQLCGELRRERVVAEYFNWNGTRAGKLNAPPPVPLSPGIATMIREHVQTHPADRVAIVGNSWGGLTALEVAQNLAQPETPLAIDCVILLDPSSVVRALAKPKSLPVNVNRAVNYFTRNGFVWGKLPPDDRLENIDLGDPVNGYMRDGLPKYGDPFNIRAHIAAEWDDRIHADIKRRLLEFVTTRDE